MIANIKRFTTKVCSYIQGPNADPTIKRYNCIIAGLVLFIGLYVTFLFVKLDKQEHIIKDQLPAIISNSVPYIHPMVASNIVMTNKAVKTNTKLEIGDIVIVKYFGTIGIVTHISSPSAEMVEIVYKDNRHQLHRMELEKFFIEKANPSQLHPWDLTN